MISSFELQAQNIEEAFSSVFERVTSSHGNQTRVSELSIYPNDKIPPIHELFDSLGISQLLQSLSQLDFTAQMLLLGVGLVIFLGIAGESFFKRTGIPDIAFLMIFGVILGPLLGIVDQEIVFKIVPYFAPLALIMIMFDRGLSLDIRNVVKTAHFAVLISIVGFAVSILIVTLLAVYGLRWAWLDSILLGSIVGGSSSIIVFGLVKRLHVSDETKSMLGLESAITDILATIGAFLLFETILTGQFDLNLI